MPANAPYEVSSCPATGAASVTPHDTNQLAGGTCRALYIGTTGNVKVTMANGNEVTFSSVAVGILPISVKLVWSTGTTASNILALY